MSDTGYLRKVGAYAYFSLETAIYIRLKINIYEAIIFHVLSNGMKVWLCLSLSLCLCLSLKKEDGEMGCRTKVLKKIFASKRSEKTRQ